MSLLRSDTKTPESTYHHNILSSSKRLDKQWRLRKIRRFLEHQTTTHELLLLQALNSDLSRKEKRLLRNRRRVLLNREQLGSVVSRRKLYSRDCQNQHRRQHNRTDLQFVSRFQDDPVTTGQESRLEEPCIRCQRHMSRTAVKTKTPR